MSRTYLPRLADQRLAALMEGMYAVSIEGARGVGKTVTGSRVAATVLRLDDVAQRTALQANRNIIRTLAGPVLIDEWQLDPPIWDTVRRAVDDAHEVGRYLLTGSASIKDATIHSGAGRFVKLRMRPLSFAERQLHDPTISLAALWNGEAGEILGSTEIDTRGYAEAITSSGFPGIQSAPDELRASVLRDYIDQIVSHDLPGIGMPTRRPTALRSWLRAYAGASSTTASFEAIARATPEGQNLSRQSISQYRSALTELWLLDEVPAYIGADGGLRRLGAAPKHQLVDPALAAALLEVDATGLTLATSDPRVPALQNGPLLGALFESLVTQSVRVYADAIDGGLDVSHLRTHEGSREIDLVLGDGTGRTLAIEVKLTASIGDRDVRHLNWLHEKIGDRLVDRLVITAGPYAYRRRDGVAVVPLALLGP